jgi:hypothetical protein
MTRTTIAEYAILRGISSRAVRKAIRNGHYMPGVFEVVRVGNRYYLQVDKEKVKYGKSRLPKQDGRSSG